MTPSVHAGTIPRSRGTSADVEPGRPLTEDHVVAAGDPGRPPSPGEATQVSLLQAEIEHRKRLEQALQEALSQRRLVEDALRASQEELKRQNEDLSRTVRFSEMFVGMLGHDLRNPLSAITTAASLLRKRADSDKVAKPAARILNSAGRMGRMIDQVLDFTRIRLGKGIPVERRELDLVETCRLAVDELDATASTRPVELRWAGGCVGHWDGDRLLQMISNLVGNALTHGRAPDPVSVHVDGMDPTFVALEVHNAGVVPEGALPTLFEPFGTNPNGRSERSHGLGLGLFIGQQIVQAHGGTIEVTSSEEAGTKFVVRLPRRPRSADAGEAGKQP
jgi:two-component system, sensor histidine kinase and response regulator